ncbi:serine/threonine-protein kinase [Streptacidiphilus neutrinimicus]|uniref:serine/threonine-protein kinase n=1 Tax=Streptacidiphilus neutrinimicus TaxID=105420 RepID=UPI0005A80F75|nr:serine/threonine-protein kinase [Streptacidiphilus neutrinimicus]
MSTFPGNPLPGTPSGLTGRRIAGYLLEHELGRGGMAVVYRARDLRLERTVAIKLLAPQLATDDTFRRRFEHESRVAAAIDHPHIVPVFEAGEADGVLYIAMRYVQGRDLAALLDRVRMLPPAQAIRITTQVASALDAAHAHELVHRDVKPGNILLAEGTDPDHPEHVYLTDFGLTKKSLSLSGFTTVGQFVGTLDYVAPEQITGKPVDGRCDVYSLACVAFEMLTGAPPFRRDDDLALLWAHQYDEPPLATALRPQLPGAVDAVLARALAKTPPERYDSCLDFVAALRAATTGAAARAPQEGHAPTQVVTAPRRHGSGIKEQIEERLEERGDRSPPPPPHWALPVYAPDDLPL